MAVHTSLRSGTRLASFTRSQFNRSLIRWFIARSAFLELKIERLMQSGRVPIRSRLGKNQGTRISFSALSNRCFNSPFHAPPTLNSICNTRGGYAKLPAPLGDRHRNSIHSKKPVITLVVSLFFSCLPIAIGFPFHNFALRAMPAAIMGVVISPFYRHSVWPLPHRGNEAFKSSHIVATLFPPRTHANTPPSIITKSSVAWVCASGNHRRPHSIYRSSCSSVDGLFVAHQLRLQAPARHRVSSDKILSCSLNGHATLASTQPDTLIPFVPTKVGLNREFAVNLSSSILKCLLRLDAWWRHNDAALVLTHGDYGLSSSEHPALLASGARAFSPETSTLSIC